MYIEGFCMKKIILIFLLCFGLNAKTITSNDVYSEVAFITDEIHYLLKYYGVKHDHDGITKRTTISTKLKPRNVWQITYEIMVKINILRQQYKLPVIEPINMAPVLHLNPDLVYEQTQRIQTELKIFFIRQGVKIPTIKRKSYKGKTPLDIFIGLSHISAAFDEINSERFTPSYVFGEQMRVYNDITLILQYLHIDDKTIPKKKNKDATIINIFNGSIKILEKIKQLQILAGIEFVDFHEFEKEGHTVGGIYTITQMILAELQTIKAYIGIDLITPASIRYNTKTPAEVEQLVSWNIRKIASINSLVKR